MWNKENLLKSENTIIALIYSSIFNFYRLNKFTFFISDKMYLICILWSVRQDREVRALKKHIFQMSIRTCFVRAGSVKQRIPSMGIGVLHKALSSFNHQESLVVCLSSLLCFKSCVLDLGHLWMSDDRTEIWWINYKWKYSYFEIAKHKINQVAEDLQPIQMHMDKD